MNTGYPSRPIETHNLHLVRLSGDPASAAANLNLELTGFYERHSFVAEWSVGE